MIGLDVAIAIRGRIQRGRLIAYGWHCGHLFVASVVLPPFVAENLAKYPDAVNIAKKKAAHAVTELIGRVTGVTKIFISTRSDFHASHS